MRIEHPRDLDGQLAVCCHAEYLFHNLARLCVHDKAVFIRGGFLITIRRKSGDIRSFTHLGRKRRTYLLGRVAGVHLVDDVLERGDVRVWAVGIIAVVDSDIANAFRREIDLCILSGCDIVAAESGQILRDHKVDLFCLDVRDHPLEVRPVEVRAAPAVVHIFIKNQIAVVRRIASKHFALRRDARTLRCAVVVSRQAHIQRRFVG